MQAYNLNNQYALTDQHFFTLIIRKMFIFILTNEKNLLKLFNTFKVGFSAHHKLVSINLSAGIFEGKP